MARSVRIEMAGGVFHVTNRGLERRDVVLNDDDRRTWRRLFDRVARRCGWQVYAYVLMDNHFHIYLRTPQPNLSVGMHDFESGYAALFNRRHARVGPLLQGRFHAVLVEHDAHAWEVSRYVHLNPIRAGKSSDAANYFWGSYRYYLDPRDAPAWLDWRSVLADFAGTEAAARLAYRRFVEAGVAAPPRNPLERAVDGWILGSEGFVRKVQEPGAGLQMTNLAGARSTLVPRTDGAHSFTQIRRNSAMSVEAVLRAVADLTGAETTQFQAVGRHANRARDAAILLCRELLSEPLDVIAARFGGVSRSAITESVRRSQKRLGHDADFRSLVNAARHALETQGSGVQFSKFADEPRCICQHGCSANFEICTPDPNVGDNVSSHERLENRTHLQRGCGKSLAT